MVKNPPAKQETQIRSLGQEDPLEKEVATHVCWVHMLDGYYWLRAVTVRPLFSNFSRHLLTSRPLLLRIWRLDHNFFHSTTSGNFNIYISLLSNNLLHNLWASLIHFTILSTVKGKDGK